MGNHRAGAPSQGLAIAGITGCLALLFILTTTLVGGSAVPHPPPYEGVAVLPVRAEVPVSSVPSGPLKADPAWANRLAARTDISPVAALAYGTAALRLAREQPRCKIGWTTLAGIGSVESNHGTNGGASLLADGSTSQPILGPALDGSGNMNAIPSGGQSAPGGKGWDHAIGPMQFIQSTWQTWGADASGDGVADPNNIIDAAYTAARYLCASGADLTTAQGWSRAVFSYNHSDDYVRNVAARANGYAIASR